MFKRVEAGPTGIEPAAYGLRGEDFPLPCYPSEKELDLKTFREYLKKNHCEKTIRDILYYAGKYSSCLTKRDFSLLNGLSIANRRHCLASLSNLAKYLGIHEDFKKLVKNYGFKWENTKAEDLLISRLNKYEELGSVIDWVKSVKTELPSFSVYMDFLVATGLRMVEGISSYNLIIDLSEKNELAKYYNEEKQILEHFRFKQIFIRNNKKAFVSFVPKELIQKVTQAEPTTIDSITHKIKRKKLRPRFNDIREYFATSMTKFLNPSEIDFLQGRISGSVFMRNYFNPALITDLKERVFKGIANLNSNVS